MCILIVFYMVLQPQYDDDDSFVAIPYYGSFDSSLILCTQPTRRSKTAAAAEAVPTTLITSQRFCLLLFISVFIQTYYIVGDVVVVALTDLILHPVLS